MGQQCFFSDWDAWFLSTRLSSKLKSLLEGVFLTAWWSIWSFRNRLLFDDVPPRRSRIFDDIVSCSFNCAFNSESNPLERKDAEGPSLDEIGFCVRRMLVGVESDSCGLFRSEIRDVMVMYNAGVLRIDGKRIWKMITGEILGVHSQGDCVYVTTVTK
ncbi:hypothetical protein Tco_0780926 [Tanacetum coccineum]